MYRIRAYATSANVGSGFDVLGIALNLYNEYIFQKSDEFCLEGFAPRYLDLNKNLVLSSYKKAFEIAKQPLVPVKIIEVKNLVPRAGGLGSSAVCIVAGVLGANKMMGDLLSQEQIFNIAVQIEGHPDNVAPAIFGSLVASYKVGNEYKCEKYPINSNLKFMIAYPDFYVSTEKARQVLPKSIPLKSVVENLSRIVNLPRAFSSGDIELIKECVKDNVHEPYRTKLIDECAFIKSYASECGVACVISGSGASLLFISDNQLNFEKIKQLKTKRKWTFIDVEAYRGD